MVEICLATTIAGSPLIIVHPTFAARVTIEHTSELAGKLNSVVETTQAPTSKDKFFSPTTKNVFEAIAQLSNTVQKGSSSKVTAKRILAFEIIEPKTTASTAEDIGDELSPLTTEKDSAKEKNPTTAKSVRKNSNNYNNKI